MKLCFGLFRSFLSLLFLTPLFLSAQGDEKGMDHEARVLVNLLDYIGQDYAHAIKDGKVIDKFEYKEMEEFVERVRARSGSIDSLLRKDRDPLSFGEEVDSLDTLIAQKAPHDKVYTLTASMKKAVLKKDLMKVAPQEYPDISEGERIFSKKCARCHGKKGAGNGPDAEGMKPPPTDLRDRAYMQKVAPLKIFNTARLGIEGTNMRAFDELSDKEVWNVAFYISSLRYQEQERDSAAHLYEDLESPPSLKELTLSTDEELLKEKPSGMDSSDYLAALRLHREKSNTKDVGRAVLDTAKRLIQETLTAYEKGYQEKAKELAISAYLDGVEPIEKRLGTHSPGLVDSLESGMMTIREGIKDGVPQKALKKQVERVKGSLEKASLALKGEGAGYWAVFMITVSIILREGLEAFLIILAILSVLRSMNVRRASVWVHGGWVLALLIGIASWGFADRMMEEIGMGRIEIMEGIGAFTAVLILLFVGYWLHSRSEISKWKDFVENKVQRLTKEENMFGLGFFAFIVVIREAFESVIFLFAIRLGAAEEAAGAIPVATLLTLLLVFVLAYFALRFSQRLPIRVLFRVSSIMLGILAVILMGKGIHAVQESGYLSLSSLPFDMEVPLLGFYPSYESFLAQILTIGLCVFLWIQGNKPLHSSS